MNKVQQGRGDQGRSTFGERFAFARWWQTGNSLDETDGDFVAALGYRSKATASNWRAMESPLPTDVCRAIGKRTGVNSDWLELGERSSAPAPIQFAKWLRAYRKGLSARPSERTASGAPRLPQTRPIGPPATLPKVGEGP